MFSYKFINKPKQLKLNKTILDSIFGEISLSASKNQSGTVNLIFDDDENIRRLNKEYRGIDNYTDVLSFHYFEDFVGLKKSEVVGEVLLSFSKILTQSIDFGNTIEEETYKLVIHSILHILGFDHENDKDHTIMGKIENEIIEKINKMYNISIK